MTDERYARIKELAKRVWPEWQLGLLHQDDCVSLRPTQRTGVLERMSDEQKPDEAPAKVLAFRPKKRDRRPANDPRRVYPKRAEDVRDMSLCLIEDDEGGAWVYVQNTPRGQSGWALDKNMAERLSAELLRLSEELAPPVKIVVSNDWRWAWIVALLVATGRVFTRLAKRVAIRGPHRLVAVDPKETGSEP